MSLGPGYDPALEGQRPELGPEKIQTHFGNGLGLTNIQMLISGTNNTPPADPVTIKARVLVLLPDSTVWKMPLYQ